MSVDYTDIEATEPEYFNTLKSLLEFSIEDLMLELTFSVETLIFGKLEV